MTLSASTISQQLEREGTLMSDEFTTEHTITRLRVPLRRPYAQAIEDFERVVPLVDVGRFEALTSWDEVVELVESEAPLGLMRYASIDVQPFLAASTSNRPGTEYLMGNHVFAERMYRHAPATMLYAPLRLFIYADYDEQAVLVMEQPSTEFGSLGNPDVTAVGVELDEKVAGVLAALGVELPASLTASARTL
jgi:uncharacterized protein (DUF302 family)